MPSDSSIVWFVRIELLSVSLQRSLLLMLAYSQTQKSVRAG